MQLAGHSSLAGTARTADCRPLPDARVALLDPDGNVATVTTTGPDGTYSFENLPPGEMASRRALVLWSDGTQGEALRWYADEVLVCEGDLIGKTQAELRSLHFRRDRDWLQS